MNKKEKYDFKQLGAKYGAEIANCSEALIESLVNERMRLLNTYYDIKAAVDFRTGAYAAIEYIRTEKAKKATNVR